MVITIMSILEVLFLTIIVGLYFCIVNKVLIAIHQHNNNIIHKVVKKSIIWTILMMAIVWISASILTLKNIGTFLYHYQQSGYLIFAILLVVFTYILQKIWSKVINIIRGNMKHVNKSDTVQTLNRWRNKK